MPSAGSPLPPCPFRALLPPAIVLVQADRADWWEIGLLPEEQLLVSRAVPRRQREFTAGRNCARAALRALGWPDERIGAIGMGAHGEPMLPPGVIGSITHSDSFCAAALAHDDGAIVSLGIDAEANTRPKPGLAVVFMQTDEWDRWQAATPTGCDAGVLAFSMKEAFFKAVFPRCRRWLDFEDVRLEHASFDDGTGRVRFVVLDDELASELEGVQLDGRYAFDSGLVYSAVTLTRSGSSGGWARKDGPSSGRGR